MMIMMKMMMRMVVIDGDNVDDDKRNFKNGKIWSNHKCNSIKGKSGLKCLGKNGGNGNGGGVNFGGCWRSKGKDHQ